MVDFVVAVVPATYLDAGRAAAVGAHVVPGGSSRRESVAFGLARLPETVDVVLIHDAARAFAPGSLVVDVVTAVRAGHRAVVPAVAVTDTVRRVGGGVVDRAGLVVVQTPQGFDRGLLVAAHRGSSQLEATDDAALAEATGAVVHVVPGHEEAFKVTGPLDLLLAEAVQARRTAGQAQ